MNSSMRRFAVLGVVSVLTACSGTVSPRSGAAVSAAVHCPNGTRPPLSECAYDGLTADCGGDGSDRWFACDATSCRFFVDGCVAEGFESSLCNLEEACCPALEFDHAPGPIDFWSTMFRRNFGHAASELGAAYVLDVVAAAPAVSEAPGFTCPASPSIQSYACMHGAHVAAQPSSFLHATTTTRAIEASNGLGAEGFLIDVSHPVGDAARARVCAYTTTDAVPISCNPTPTDLQPLRCATSGTVTWDGVGAGHADVVIAEQTWAIDF